MTKKKTAKKPKPAKAGKQKRRTKVIAQAPKKKRPAGRRKNKAESRAMFPGEVEARRMLIIGAKAGDVAIATGLTAERAGEIAAEIRKAMPGPFTADAAARLVGMAYRTMYHAIRTEEIKATKRDTQVLNGGTETTKLAFSISLDSIKAYCRRRLNEDGQRKARYLIFVGAGDQVVKMRSGLSADKIKALRRELDHHGIGPTSTGPYNVKQAAVLLDVKPRLVCRYCDEGLLFNDVDAEVRSVYGVIRKYLITRETLERFGVIDRRPGKVGQLTRQAMASA